MGSFLGVGRGGAMGLLGGPDYVNENVLMLAVGFWIAAVLVEIVGPCLLRSFLSLFATESKYKKAAVGDRLSAGYLFRTALQNRVPRKLCHALAWALILIGLYIIKEHDETHDNVSKLCGVCVIISMVFVIVALMQANIAAIDAVCDVLMEYVSSTASKVDDEIVPVIQETAKLLTTVYWLGILLQSLGIDMTMAVASLSVGTAVLTLACKDRPFEVSDFIKFQGVVGTVQGVSLRTTVVKQVDGTFSYIPNNQFLTKVVNNLSKI